MQNLSLPIATANHQSKIWIFTIILLSAFATPTLSQIQALGKKVKLQRLALSKVLSNSYAVDIAQHRYGYMWIGTEDGINRFDGYSIEVYRSDPRDSLTLLRNNVKSIFEDCGCKLLILTGGGGVQSYDRSQDAFRRILDFNTNCDITRIYEDDGHNLLALGVWRRNGAVVKFDTVTNKVTPYQITAVGRKSQTLIAVAHAGLKN